MARRPYWSGQIRVALVFLPVQLYTATQRSAQVPMHQYDRETEERIHHRNVNESGKEMDADDIVRGYETKDKGVIFLEDDDIEGVKLPSSDMLELLQFVDATELPAMYFERPYYVMPDGSSAPEIYAVLRNALEESGKIGIGQLTMRGREELCALMPHGRGLMLQTLRYPKELIDEKEFFGDLKLPKPDGEYVTLARQLVKQKSVKPDLDMFHDHYHEALMELIKAKTEDRKPVYKRAEAPSDKVVNLMDALKASLGGKSPAAKTKKPVANENETKKPKAKQTKTKDSKVKKPAGKRKTA